MTNQFFVKVHPLYLPIVLHVHVELVHVHHHLKKNAIGDIFSMNATLSLHISLSTLINTDIFLLLVIDNVTTESNHSAILN